MRSPALVKNFLILSSISRKNLPRLEDFPNTFLFPSIKYQFPCVNPIKIEFLAF